MTPSTPSLTRTRRQLQRLLAEPAAADAHARQRALVEASLLAAVRAPERSERRWSAGAELRRS